MKTIDMSWLYRNGYLPLGKLGGFTRGGMRWTDKWSSREDSIGFYISISEENMYFQPMYSLTGEYGEKETLDYKISLTTSRCYYGGKRYWFICPMAYCRKRVGTLYMGNKYFGCRHCYHITYSRNENRRHKFQWMAIEGRLEEKVEVLELSILTKRRWYDAKPTKIQRKLNALFQKLYGYDRPFD